MWEYEVSRLNKTEDGKTRGNLKGASTIKNIKIKYLKQYVAKKAFEVNSDHI